MHVSVLDVNCVFVPRRRSVRGTRGSTARARGRFLREGRRWLGRQNSADTSADSSTCSERRSCSTERQAHPSRVPSSINGERPVGLGQLLGLHSLVVRFPVSTPTLWMYLLERNKPPRSRSCTRDTSSTPGLPDTTAHGHSTPALHLRF